MTEQEEPNPQLRGRRLENYPPNLFTQEQRENGAIVLHFIGVIYMFVGLAVICDEYFVPALEVITERVGVSDDVAGATFMAAGGSAPELFTSFIGVFASESEVGFGTIVGSAVFNVLFVIGMCAVFSKELLALTWWPLFRDSMYYCACLIILVSCFWDQDITLVEAIILLALYVGYVTLMAYNIRLYTLVSKCIGKKHPSRSAAVAAAGMVSQRDITDANGLTQTSVVEVPSGTINVMRVPRTFRAGG